MHGRATLRGAAVFLTRRRMSYDAPQAWQHSNPMVFRLLYRLLLQSLDRGADAELERSATAGRPRTGAVARYPRRRAATVLAVVAGACMLGAAAYFVLAPTPPAKGGGPGATLRLTIPAVDPEPVVVYLRGDVVARLLPDAHRSTAGRIRSIDTRFSPAFQVLPPASILEMSNADTVAHNTHVFSRGETVFNVALPEQGVTVRKVLKGDGIFDVRCDMHPWMKAWVFVSPSPHYAVVREPTTVTFSDVVPGEYIMHLWQPNRQERLHSLDLGAGESRHLRLR